MPPQMKVVNGRDKSGHDDAKASSLCRRNAQNAAGRVVRKQVKRSVWALPDVPDAFIQSLQQALLFDDLAVLDLKPRQQLEFQCAVEQVALPGGKKIARVKSHA